MCAMSTESSYKSVEKLIFSKGKVLYIISPYISDYYLKILKRVSSRKKVYLITSGASYENAVRISGIHALGHPRILHGFLVVAFAAIFVIAHEYVLSLLAMDAFAAWAAIFSFAMLLPEKRGNMRVRTIKDNFVHEKIYITDNYAITGSANLTYSGMHKNTERIGIVEDKKELSELKGHFAEMWKKGS